MIMLGGFYFLVPNPSTSGEGPGSVLSIRGGIEIKIRSPKSETNPKSESPMFKTEKGLIAARGHAMVFGSFKTGDPPEGWGV
jgi:hypothetical protein